MPERASPLAEEAAAAGFASNREWAVSELKGLARVNK